ncbi:hypothetical protein [Salegentibacter salegens]|uniref:Uncharacterized protein n=1 Tax=Salegentibacter salegens TaxID=143223 RepID=A0A1M7NJP1_9FLAO|nr:hypothetical protein [Salegentibacter salegens]PRX39840.1 hypothetical protein LY58_03264 [Salegentibacter salegens]SHN03919.1 hypothetical protein SAMN05878281_3212 [Salegentibacter salegens]
MKRHLEIAFVFLLVIISFQFFDAQFLNESIVRYLLFISLIVTVIISVPYVIPPNKGFVFPIQLLLASMLISVLMAGLFWDQSLKESLVALAPYLVLIFFFYLLHINFSVAVLERIIVIYGVIYILLYLFSYINSPTVFFGKPSWGEEFLESRGIIRIVFPGGGVFILTTFIALNKLTSQKKNIWFWMLLALAGIIIPVMQVTRQFIAGILLIYLYHFIRNLSLSKKVLILVSFLAAIIFLQNTNISVVKGLIEATQSDVSSGGDYIRILAGEYFLTDFSPNQITQFFGNGVPHFGVSNYGFHVEMLWVNYEFYLSDVGIIAVYVMFGVPAIIAYLLIWIKSFIIPLPKEYQYLKYYLWFMLLTSLTWYTPYHYYFLIVNVYVLYMYQAVYLKQEENKMESKKTEFTSEEDSREIYSK